jgi:cytoskeletal protein CcmA (bactofilin family)
VPKITTVIGQDVTLHGELTLCGGLHVEGSIKGEVISGEGRDCILVLSELDAIEGDVLVENFIINGRVIGDGMRHWFSFISLQAIDCY